MSSIFKGLRLNEGIDFDALQAEGQRKKDAINANPEMYSKKYGIPMDHKHFLGAVLVAMDREEQRERQQKRDAEYKANQEASHTKQLSQDKENIGQLKAQLVQLQKGFDPYYDRSDDYTFWNEQNRIAGQISALKKRISNVEGQQLDELSNEKLGQYKTAAAANAGKADLAGDYKKADKRFSGIVKATKKQFANDAKTVKEDINAVYKEAKSLLTQLDESTQQQVINALKKNVDAEKDKQKSKYPRLDNPKILGTNNKAKSIYYPPSKPNVKKLDKPLPESLGDQLKSKSLDALQQVKQNIEQQRMADLEQWEKDFKQNTVSKFTARQPSFMQQQPKQVARPLEKHSVLKARLAQLDKAIEKQAVLDKMLQRLDAKGLLTPAIQSDTDTSMLVRDGANDNYVSLNQKLDKALEFVKNRLLTNKAAFAKPKAIDENEELDENLHKWFKEKWVRFGPDGKIRGDCARGDDSEGKPKCLPQSKAHSLGKKGRASAASRKRREDPNPERSGKAINVNTKKKTNEAELDEACWKGYHKEGNKKMFGKTYPNCVKNTNEDSLNEFAPDGFNGGDDDEGFSPEIAKMAQDDGFTKGAGHADGATLERAMAINHWHSTHGGMYKQYFAKGFKSGRMDKIRHNNKQYNLNLKLMKDGSIRHGEQNLDEYGDTSKGQKMLAKVHHRAADRVTSKKADTDPQYARKSQQTQDRAHDRLKDVAESHHGETCPHCGGEMVSEELMNEKKDACYYKVKSRYKVWPSAYASGALVKCRKKGASNWGNGGKSNESVAEDDAGDVEQRMIAKIEKEKQRLAKLKQTDPEAYKREIAKSKTSSKVPPVSTFEDQGVAEEQLDEKWTKKYKDSINCSNPKGFSQKAHCAGKQKNESAILKGLKL